MGLKQKSLEIAKQYNMEKEYNRIDKLLKTTYDGELYLFDDEEEGNPDNKFLTGEVILPFPDGLVFMTSAKELNEVLHNIEEYING